MPQPDLAQALLGDPAWRWADATGPLRLSFAFAEAGQGDGTPDWTPFSPAQRQAARDALAAWTSGTGLGFVEVPDRPGGAGIDLRFRLQDFTDPWWRAGEASLPPEGDIALSLRFFARDALPPGRSGYETLLHEIGHALGLKHPFEGPLTLPSALDNRDVTLMAYERGETGFASAPRALDLAAIRLLYGETAPDGSAAWDAASGRIRLAGGAGAETLTGTALADEILGNGGADTLRGGVGDDVLHPGLAAVLAEGGAGFDRLVLDVAHDALPLAQGRIGELRFSGIEALEFLDGRLALDAADPAALAARLLLGATGSTGDAIQRGRLLAAPDPAQAALAETPPDIATLYERLLHRAPEAAGLAFWQAQTAQGLDAAGLLSGIAGSAEAQAQQTIPAGGLWAADPQALVVRQLYTALLDRAPEAGGLEWGLDLLRQHDATALAEALLNGAEFLAAAEQPLLEHLYLSALGRTPDAAGATYWNAQRAAGLSDAQLALGIATSLEAEKHTDWFGG